MKNSNELEILDLLRYVLDFARDTSPRFSMSLHLKRAKRVEVLRGEDSHLELGLMRPPCWLLHYPAETRNIAISLFALPAIPNVVGANPVEACFVRG